MGKCGDLEVLCAIPSSSMLFSCELADWSLSLPGTFVLKTPNEKQLSQEDFFRLNIRVDIKR